MPKARFTGPIPQGILKVNPHSSFFWRQMAPVEARTPSRATAGPSGPPQTRYAELKRQVQHDAVLQACDSRAELATQERLGLAQEQVLRLEREWRNSSGEAARLAAELQKERSRAERRHAALKRSSEVARAARQEEIDAAVRAERARCKEEICELRQAVATEAAAAREEAETEADGAIEAMTLGHKEELERLRWEARERSALHASRQRMLMDSEEEAQQTCAELLTQLQGAAAANLALTFRLGRARCARAPVSGHRGHCIHEWLIDALTLTHAQTILYLQLGHRAGVPAKQIACEARRLACHAPLAAYAALVVEGA